MSVIDLGPAPVCAMDFSSGPDLYFKRSTLPPALMWGLQGAGSY